MTTLMSLPSLPVFALALLAAYLLGSVPFAVISSRAFGLADPRSYGSKNPGATNVLRSGNKAAAVFTLLGDLGKGVVAVLVARHLAESNAWSSAFVGWVAFAAFVGHLFPVFLGFKGGKGVATAAGVLLAIDWRLGLAILASWLLVAFTLRYSSLAAIVAGILAPFGAWLLWGIDPRLPAVTLIAICLLVKHRANLARLLSGTEPKIGAKKTAP